MRFPSVLLSLLLASPALAAEAPPSGPLIWQKRCAGCHGADGKADTTVGAKYHVADFTQPAWQKELSLAKVKEVVEQGVPKKMPAWKDRLSPEEIEAVSAYVKTLK